VHRAFTSGTAPGTALRYCTAGTAPLLVRYLTVVLHHWYCTCMRRSGDVTVALRVETREGLRRYCTKNGVTVDGAVREMLSGCGFPVGDGGPTAPASPAAAPAKPRLCELAALVPNTAVGEASGSGICNDCGRELDRPMRRGPEHARACGFWRAA